jgi:SH3-like domain-containing protein
MARAPRAWLLAALLAAPPVLAAEFKCVAENAAVLYDAPSRAAVALYVVSRDYPLEVVVNTEAWVKVRDHTGALSWIERKSLSDRRMVVVTAVSAPAYLRPEEGAPVAFTAAQNVSLELMEIAPGGWARVRHADGTNGYVRAAQLWGL